MDIIIKDRVLLNEFITEYIKQSVLSNGYLHILLLSDGWKPVNQWTSEEVIDWIKEHDMANEETPGIELQDRVKIINQICDSLEQATRDEMTMLFDVQDVEYSVSPANWAADLRSAIHPIATMVYDLIELNRYY